MVDNQRGISKIHGSCGGRVTAAVLGRQAYRLNSTLRPAGGSWMCNCWGKGGGQQSLKHGSLLGFFDLCDMHESTTTTTTTLQINTKTVQEETNNNMTVLFCSAE